jgi:hypothetical protein
MESVWYYAREGAQTGPASFDDLMAAVATGRLAPDDLVWKEGTTDWVAARNVVGLFPTPDSPPRAPLPPAQPPRMPAPAKAAEPLPIHDQPRAWPGGEGKAAEIAALARVFLNRTAAANPAAIAPTPEEEQRLTQAGYDAVAKKYAVWRRAVLWVSVVPTAFAALFQIINLLNMDESDKADLSGFGTLLLFLQAFALCALPLAAAFGALGYDRLSKSSRTVLIGGLISLGVPLLVAFAPASWFLNLRTGARTTVAEAEAQRQAAGMIMGISFYLLLMPMVLSLLPAVSRGCVRVKGFLPESLVPGWGLVASIPLFVLLTLATFVVIYHFASNILLLLGLLLWIGAPLLYLTKFRLLTRPLTESQDLATLARTQLYVLGTMAAGILLIIIYLFTAKFMGKTLVGTSQDSHLRIWSLSLHRIWIEYIGRSLFLTVLFSDLLVRMALMVWREERAFAGTGPAGNFDVTMSGLGEAIEAKGIPPVA